jgi:hypothetical protein
VLDPGALAGPSFFVVEVFHQVGAAPLLSILKSQAVLENFVECELHHRFSRGVDRRTIHFGQDARALVRLSSINKNPAMREGAMWADTGVGPRLTSTCFWPKPGFSDSTEQTRLDARQFSK